MKVKEGISFLLSHFEGRQRLFPRKMSTFATNGGQFQVHNEEQIFQACKRSNFIDCRLNAYPVFGRRIVAGTQLYFHRFRFT